jgi:hypothetical protein
MRLHTPINARAPVKRDLVDYQTLGFLLVRENFQEAQC